MLTIYSIKPKFQKILRPLLRFCAEKKVTPNQITLFACLLSVGFGLYGNFWLLPIAFLLRMALNALDGMLAREYRLQTPLGTYLNELGDLVSDLFLYLPFLWKFPSCQGLFIAVIFLSLFTEVAGLLAVSVKRERRYDGPMGKSDRAFCFSVLSLLIALGWIADFGAALFCAALIPTLLMTIFFRIKNGLRQNGS